MHPQAEKLNQLFTEAKKNNSSLGDDFFDLLWQSGTTVPAAEYRELIEEVYEWIKPKQAIEQKNFCRVTLALGFVEFNAGKYELSLKECFRAQKLFEEINDKDGMQACGSIIGLNYRTLGEVELAVKNLLEAYKHLTVTGGYRIYRAFSAYNLAEIYSEINQTDDALAYYKIAEQISDEVGSKGMKARVLTGVGALYTHQKKYSLALDALNRSLQLCDEVGNMVVKARALTEFGNYYTETGDYEQALEAQQQALDIRERLKIPNSNITNLILIGDIYQRQGKLDDAVTTLEKALMIAEEVKVKPKIFQIHCMLSDIYQAKGNSQKCLFHYKAFHRIREEVQHEDNERKIKNLHLIYEAEQTQKENAIIKSQKADIERQKAEIERKNVQLQHTVDELTRTRVSRKAKAITLVIAVFLFLLEEVVLRLTEEVYTHNSLVLSLTIKGAIILSLKPIETFIESFLLRKIMREKI